MPTDTNSSTAPDRLGVDEHEAAAALGLSVHTLRKDRVNKRRIPFYKVGGRVLYNLDRMRAALAALECGGPPAARPRRPS
jgi:hypothetical protein